MTSRPLPVEHSSVGAARATTHRVGTDAFAEAVLDIVMQIPPGLVMSYGSIAAELGSRASRQVGKVMAQSGHDVPWWRVVHADGRPADGHEAAALERYREEGTPLRQTPSGYRIAMRDATWHP